MLKLKARGWKMNSQKVVLTNGGSIAEDDKNILLDYPVLYLNLWYRNEKGETQKDIITNMTDSLIVWALRDTDPQNGIFLNDQTIYSNIEAAFPTAKQTVKSIFKQRLEMLQRQRTPEGRQTVQKHKSGYCLPIETRVEYTEKAKESEDILMLVKGSFLQRISEVEKYNNPDKQKQVIELMLHTIKHLFTDRGIRFVQELQNESKDSYDEINLRDSIQKAAHDIDATFRETELSGISIILRKVFANPNKHEQEYLTRASYLYIMHYIMHNDMSIATYFKNRNSRLNLIVHSDVIIRALSEEYLPESGRHYRNILKYLSSVGAILQVTEEALTEVYKNLHIASIEYKNHIKDFEEHFSYASIKYLPVLMTRAYLYSRLDGKVNNWHEFIDNFCNPNLILNNGAQTSIKEDLRVYLTDKFSLSILRSDDMRTEIDIGLAEELALLLEPHKKKKEIARHVAFINVYISEIRHKNKEVSKDPFGYKTYWLTHEKIAYAVAKDFFDKHEIGSKIIMRPEFIMQQIMLTPDAESIAKSHTATFPTALGIQMSQQIDRTTFHLLMEKLKEISAKDNSRAKAILNDAIQVASEQTTLVPDSEFYEHEAIVVENNDIDSNLREKITMIIAEAEKRNHQGKR